MRIAVPVVLYLVQQGFDRNGGKHFLGLLNGGKPDARQTAIADVVKAQKRKITRDANIDFLGSLHDSQGIGVSRSKDRRVTKLLRKKLLGKLVAILDGG